MLTIILSFLIGVFGEILFAPDKSMAEVRGGVIIEESHREHRPF